MQVPFAGKSQGNFNGRRSGPKPPPGSKVNNSNNVRPAKPDKYLVKLEADNRAEELKARIRAAKMILQGLNGIKTLLRPPGRPGGREKGILRHGTCKESFPAAGRWHY
jgi:hypothetical protein